MKKHLSGLITMILIITSASAQKLSYALKGGLNISSGTVKNGSTTYSGSALGFHAGALAKKEFTSNISFQPGVLFSMKNANVDDKNLQLKINLLTIDIPLTVVYEKDKFFGGLGPNLNFGLSGRYKYYGEKYDLYDKDNNGNFSIKRFEIGLNVLAGYKLNKDMFVSVNFTPGLNNLFNSSEYSDSGTKVHTRVIGISFGKFIR